MTKKERLDYRPGPPFIHAKMPTEFLQETQRAKDNSYWQETNAEELRIGPPPGAKWLTREEMKAQADLQRAEAKRLIGGDQEVASQIVDKIINAAMLEMTLIIGDMKGY